MLTGYLRLGQLFEALTQVKWDTSPFLQIIRRMYIYLYIEKITSQWNEWSQEPQNTNKNGDKNRKTTA